MQLYTWLIEPFAEFDFMRYALASVVFLALSAAPMGVFLMMRRMSLVGDALGHAHMAGKRRMLRARQLQAARELRQQGDERARAQQDGDHPRRSQVHGARIWWF